MTIEEWNEWLFKAKGVNVQMYYNEYLAEKKLQARTKREFFNFVCDLTSTTLHDLTFRQKTRSRGGSNKIPRVRGYIVKSVLLNRIEGFNTSNVYTKIFGFRLDHATAIHHRDVEHMGQEKQIYDAINNYIKTYTIIWEH